MPTRYSNIHLSHTWYASASGKRTRTKESEEKRKHRKSHGKVSFQELSRSVASRWANLEETDPETKIYCAKIADRELQVYKQKVKLYKASLAVDERRTSLNSSFESSSSSIISPEMTSHTQHSSVSSIASIHSPAAESIQSTGITPVRTSKPKRSFEVSSEFHPTWMSTKLNLTGSTLDEAKECHKHENHSRSVSSAKRKAEESTSIKRDEFSFFPLPPCLQEKEDSFLMNIQKKQRLSPNISQYLSHEIDEDRADTAAINGAIFDSNMRDLDTRISYAIESERKDSDMKRETSDVSLGQISPLCLGDSILPLECTFTTADAEYLLKVLF
jgi:hypothetical protein